MKLGLVLAACGALGAQTDPRIFNMRGAENFRNARIEASIADFTRAIELDPEQEPHHWQRGISFYYAGRFEEGRRQFERHRLVNPEDVENAVWHYLCYSKIAGAAEARAALIPIHDDGRVPMMQIYEMFRGKAAPSSVIAVAGAGREALFFAHLYIGLYYEAEGDAAKSREHIALAASRYAQNHYMGDVARVHQRLRKAAKK
jgi:lipoprotein NlpI